MTTAWLKPFGIDPVAWRKEGRLVDKIDAAYPLPYGNDLAKGLSNGIDAYIVQGRKPIAALVHTCKAELDDIDLRQYGELLWNQGLVSVFIVRLAKMYRIYSVIHNDSVRDIPTLVEEVTDAISIIPSIEEGVFFGKNKDMFPEEHRVDQCLLNNLEAARRQLVGLGLSPSSAQSLLLQVIFIAYLEDREIIGEALILQATEGKYRNFAEILEKDDISSFKKLFNKLKHDFNGDVFVSPGSFDPKNSSSLGKGQLACLLGFRRSDIDPSGQRRLFYMYDFKFIPITLLSAIYDRFLQIDDDSDRKTEKKKSLRRQEGSYYTPATLAQLCLDLAWEQLPKGVTEQDDFSVLDPACGSGVFLVCAFQRLVGLYRRKFERGKSIPWLVLIGILQKKFTGCDKEARALRVGIVSLYIALLENLEPPAIDRLRQRGHLLPELFNVSMFEKDFFDFQGKLEGYDLIIGNPPWISRDADSAILARTWIGKAYPENRDVTEMLPNQSPMWGFIWKSAKMIKPNGVAALLINATHLFGIQSREALRNLTGKYSIRGIINFSDARFQLFKHAKAPAAFLLFGQNDSNADTLKSKRMFFWSPKANPDYSLDKRIVLSSEDRSWLSNRYVENDPGILTQYKWGRGRDRALLDDLTIFMPLSYRIKEWRDCKSHVPSDSWVIGQGYNPGTRIDAPTCINEFDFLPAKCETFSYAFDPQYLTRLDIHPLEQPKVDYLRLLQPIMNGRISPPFVLVAQGVRKNKLAVSYTERRILFTKDFQAIVSPKGIADAGVFKILTAVLSSRLAIWFYLHRSSVFGVERDKLLQNELPLLPFPLPSESPSADAGNAIIKEMTEFYKKRSAAAKTRKRSGGFLTPYSDKDSVEHEECCLAEKLNPLVYEYYGLTKSEIQIIDDTSDYILPSLQPRPSAKSVPVLWQQPRIPELEKYSYWLREALEGNYSNKTKIAVTVYQGDGSLLVAEVRYNSKSGTRVERSSTKLTTKLEELRTQWPGAFHRGIEHLVDLTLADGDRIVLIKPNRIRYWMPSAGLNDADRIVADLRRELAERGGKA